MPYFFGTNKVGHAQGVLDGEIAPLSNRPSISWRKARSFGGAVVIGPRSLTWMVSSKSLWHSRRFVRPSVVWWRYQKICTWETWFCSSDNLIGSFRTEKWEWATLNGGGGSDNIPHIRGGGEMTIWFLKSIVVLVLCRKLHNREYGILWATSKGKSHERLPDLRCIVSNSLSEKYFLVINCGSWYMDLIVAINEFGININSVEKLTGN